MSDDDTTALVETLKENPLNYRSLRALDTLAQRLAEAEARYESINWSSRNWTNALKEAKAERDAAEARATRAEEALRSARNHIRFHSWRDDPNQNKRRAALDEVEAALAATPTEEPR